ncbi:glycosyl hydrolase [Autumnicola psychrophila]|uniref:Glycosyl hydrolase n=1 Tax=Autumnicola psychrophila TaxID=3075592 RepID=A0ABU3DTZ7_9FLAO|nr:glycosyl hydrolase [Zunongwangia sp. F225]MDT0687175.1 glycosyl hydrolase [Zunongwangia sp. F225]
MKKLLLLLVLLVNGNCFSQTPANKNATKEAKQFLSYIYSLGDRVLSGQHSYNEEPESYYNLAEEISGNFPAVWGTDFYWNREDNPGDRIVEAARKKHEEGAIITLMWHVGRPIDNPPFGWRTSVQAELSDADWEQLVTTGTPLNKRWQDQVDVVAESLKELQEENIPVLWRPYHEMNGVWFWWGNKKGEKGFKKLWKMLYDRMVNYHQLNNLIWVWNANGPRDIPKDEAFPYKDFYPGHEYVDILATDVYHFDYEQKDYQELLNLAEGRPIALGEVGELPKIDILEQQPKWSWFMVWSNWLETANSPERIKEIYNYPKTITRDEVEIED